MALSDHLRELRARVLKSVLFLIVAFIVALVSSMTSCWTWCATPYKDAAEEDRGRRRNQLVLDSITRGLMLNLKLCGVVAIIASSPFWLYQIWAFIVPGLHPGERKWSRVFAAVAGPLFFGGVALGYYVLPKGIAVLIKFTPDNMQSLVEFTTYFSFITRMLLVFGISMEIPLFVVMLNLAGIVSGRAIGRARPWIILGTMVFAAVATPSTDPFSMLMLAIPMLVLFAISEVIARTLDRYRGRKQLAEVPDDEISAL